VATLVTDGWTDLNGLAVIIYVAVSGDSAFFLESLYSGEESPGADFLARDVKRVAWFLITRANNTVI
jgi:hypothetical protein